MGQKEFIALFVKLFEDADCVWEDYPVERMYFDELLKRNDSPVTEKGLAILKWMKSVFPEKEWVLAKDIAEGLFFEKPRSVSGIMTKLVNDGFVEKNGQTPIAYKISDKGQFLLSTDI